MSLTLREQREAKKGYIGPLLCRVLDNEPIWGVLLKNNKKVL